jgi:hypothetical protein
MVQALLQRLWHPTQVTQHPSLLMNLMQVSPAEQFACKTAANSGDELGQFDLPGYLALLDRALASRTASASLVPTGGRPHWVRAKLCSIRDAFEPSYAASGNPIRL